MKKFAWFYVFLIVLCCVLAAFAQNGFNAARTFATAVVASDIGLQQNTHILYHQVAWATTGAPAACTFSADTSTDGNSWTVGGLIPATSCTAVSGFSSLVNGVAVFIRLNVTALSGGATVSLNYTGWAYNPFSSGLGVTIDGITQTPQSIYANTSFQGGLININAPAGSNPTFTRDLMQNTLAVNQPVVSFTGSCGTNPNFLTNGDNVSYVFVQYDVYGNTHWSPVTQSTVPAASRCSSIPPPNSIYGGLGTGQGAGYLLASQDCGVSPCTLPLTNPTIQITTTNSPTAGAQFITNPGQTQIWNFTTKSTGAVDTSICSSGAPPCGNFIPGMEPPPDNGALTVSRTTLQFNGGNYNTATGQFVIWPTSIPQYSHIRGLGRQQTQHQLDAGAPNGIPYFLPWGKINSGGTLTVGQSQSVQIGLIDSGNVVDVGPVSTSPAFTTGFQTYTVNNPMPPYKTFLWQANRVIYQGERVIDQQNPDSVWIATTTFTSTSSTPFTSALCATQGTTQISDGATNNAWKCILKGITYSATTYTYNSNDEVWDNANNAYQLNISALPGTPCTSVGAVTFATGFGGVAHDTVCNWMNIGANTIKSPAWSWFIGNCTTSATLQDCPASGNLQLDTSQGTAGVSRAFSACNGPNAIIVTCPSGAANPDARVLITSTFPPGDTLSGNPPTPTTTDVATPTGLCPGGPAANLASACVGNVFGGSNNFRVILLWATASGVMSNWAESAPLPLSAANRSLQITPPANLPPDVLGATVAICNDAEFVGTNCGMGGPHAWHTQQVDGMFVICGTNTEADYALSLQHGAICGPGKTITVVNPQTVQPYAPVMPVSNVMYELGAMWPYQNQEGNPFNGSGAPSGYDSRLDCLTAEMGRKLNTIEPYGVVVDHPLGQEGSGVGSPGCEVQLSDGGETSYYVRSFGAQNSPQSFGIHNTGVNSDYGVTFDFEDPAGSRGVFDYSNNGPLQTDAAATPIAVWLHCRPGASCNSNFTLMIQESEACIDSIRVDNTAATIISAFASVVAKRRCANTVHLGTYAHDVNVLNAKSSGSTCPLWVDGGSALFPGTACRFNKTWVSSYTLTNVGDVGGPGTPEFSPDLSLNPQTFFSNIGGGGTAGTFTADVVNSSGMYLSYPMQPTKIRYQVTTADNTTDTFDIGLYGPCNSAQAGCPLAAHIGQTAGTTFAPSTGIKLLTLLGTPYLAQGRYYIAITCHVVGGACAAVLGTGTAAEIIFIANSTSLGASSNGTLPAVVTTPSDSVTVAGTSVMIQLQP